MRAKLASLHTTLHLLSFATEFIPLIYCFLERVACDLTET